MKTFLLTILLALSTGAAPATEPTSRPDYESRSRERFERVIRRIEPSGHGDIARLPQYLEFFQREFVEDTRTFPFEVKADGSTLRGFVEFPEHKEALAGFFKQLGLENVRDQTQLLPAPSLGSKRYGLITAERTFVRDRSGEGRRESLTQCVRGDLVFLLMETPEHEFLCHAPDGYVGYIAATDVRAIDESEVPHPSPRRTSEIEQIIAAAKELMGTKYVWGAATKEGTDCSGLVRCAFKSIDINLPRDADQQYLVGRLVATRSCRAGLRRGDTLYFLGRRGTIHHTALYLGDDQYIEATDPVVKITSLRKGDPQYSEKRDQSFCFAKRILE
jgi:cell wall-associated NlpC family hydrolase